MAYRGIKDLARRLPGGPQLALSWIYGSLPPAIRYGSLFKQTRAFLRRSQWWSEDELLDYQTTELRRLLTHCRANVPYYKRVFAEAGFSPEEIRTPDVGRLPMLTKEIIRAESDRMKATNLGERDFVFCTTGGSSGTPLGFYCQNGYSIPRELAFMTMLWERAGCTFLHDNRLVLRGSVPKNSSGVQYLPATRELVCSTYLTDDSHLGHYLDCLKSRRIEVIHGHISSVALFAQYVVGRGLSHRVKAVLGGSEKPYPFQKEIVKQAFGARLFTWYGQSEMVALAGECEHSENYHIYPEYGVFELVDEGGHIIKEPGVLGEIVATGFNNYAMPFVRYRTGDMARYAPGFCEQCGRNYKLLAEVEGRTYEYVITRGGNKVSLTGLIFGQHFDSFGHIAKMQIYQNTPGKVEVRIIPGAGYSTEKCESEITGGIRHAVGDEIAVTFSYPNDIPPTEFGKHRFLIQEVEE